jgi:alkyl hydroperoxide reductase subunit AhpC
MQTYEREWPRLQALDAHVLAISNDAGPSKKAWGDSIGGVSYDLLSDHHPHGHVAAAYGVLRADGLYFVGHDVIGGLVTEINVTSPTGAREIDRLDGVSLEGLVLDFVERRAARLERADIAH